MARPATPTQPQDLVLTMLGAHLRRPGDLAWSGGLVELLHVRLPGGRGDRLGGAGVYCDWVGRW